MVIEKNTLVSIMVLLLLLLNSGLTIRDHSAADKREKEIAKRARVVEARAVALDRRLAGIEEALRQHVSR